MTDEGVVGHELPAGFRLEEFEIKSILGSGGFGITYLALDLDLGREVVIKENLPFHCAIRDATRSVRPRTNTEGDTEQFRWALQSFLREAETLSRFDHPNIVRILRRFEANNTAYFVMPHVPGKSFKQVIEDQVQRSEAFTEKALLGLLAPLLDALEALHEKQVYHRDIKPGNILLASGHKPILIDFGAARMLISEKSHTVIESAGYTPFEQLQSRGNVGPWSDIYALAGTFYTAIHGSAPPRASDRIRKDPIIKLAAEYQGHYSENFLRALDRALSPDEEDRPQSAAAWREELLNSRAPVAPVPPTIVPEIEKKSEPLPPSPPPPGGVPKIYFAAIGGGIVVLLLVILFLSRGKDDHKPSEASSSPSPSATPSAAAPPAPVTTPAPVAAFSPTPATTPAPLAQEPPAEPSAPGAADLARAKAALAENKESEAMPALRKAADSGNIEAQYLLAQIFLDPQGPQPNEAEGIRLLQRSAQGGLAAAQNDLGLCYQNEVGVMRDLNAAQRWLEAAFQQGYLPAANNLGALSQQTGNRRQAAQFYKAGAVQGDAEAQKNYGFFLLQGWGVSKDEMAALSWFEKSAGQGNLKAMNNIGSMYDNQQGVKQNFAEALKWYQMAADGGLPSAMRNIGNMYEKGRGVPVDPAQAITWYEKAAAKGDAEAAKRLKALQGGQ